MQIDFSELDTFLHTHQRLFNRSAILIRKNGHIVYSFGDIQTPVYAASCSKWLSAATFMRLVESNILNLDTPVSAYLPKLRPREKTLTLRKLLSHTGGLSAQHNGCVSVTPPLRRPVAGRLHFLNKQTPTFCYENAGFNFAGRIAVHVVQKKWSHIFRDEIAAPLALTNTYYVKSKPAAAGGAMISANDYSRFLEMIRQDGISMEGQRVLSKSSVREMLRNHTAGLEMECIPRPSPRKESHGLGMWRQGTGELPDLASHFGTTGYKVFLDFCRDVTAVFAIEHKPKNEKHARDVTRNIYDIIQRAIPINPDCAASDERPNQWHLPMRPPLPDTDTNTGR